MVRAATADTACGATHPHPSTSKPHRMTVGVFSRRKGVRYHDDGAVLNCRFCEIMRLHDEEFLYEDEHVVVFRPLRPIVPSHILIVPRAHIRNVKMLTATHRDLLLHMHRIGGSVVRTAITRRRRQPEDSSGSSQWDDVGTTTNVPTREHRGNSSGGGRGGVRYSFHIPPFNSIDHVHMHAFVDDGGGLGYFGRIKYKTESWWCRSFDDILTSLIDTEDVDSPSNDSAPPPDLKRRTA